MQRTNGAAAAFDEEDDGQDKPLNGGVCVLCEDCGEVNAATEVAEGHWEKESAMMDSGASSSFLRNGALPQLGVTPPSAKDAARVWSTADGNRIKAEGDSKVNFLTNQGDKKALSFKRSEKMAKNLASVSEVCDTGHMVIFSKTGGGIVKDPDEKWARQIMAEAEGATPFKRDMGRGTYSLDMWVPRGADRGREGNKNAKRQPEVRTVKQEERQEPHQAEELMVVPAEEWTEIMSRNAARKLKAGFTRPE